VLRNLGGAPRPGWPMAKSQKIRLGSSRPDMMSGRCRGNVGRDLRVTDIKVDRRGSNVDASLVADLDEMWLPIRSVKALPYGLFGRVGCGDSAHWATGPSDRGALRSTP
jgi:hypothetical protein